MGRIPGYVVLVHTFEQYSFAWPGFFEGWNKAGMQRNGVPMHWATDFPGSYIDAPHTLLTGPGEWSDRLITALNMIPTDTVLYIQEDHWPTKFIYLDFFYEIFRNQNLLRLQVSPVNQFYTLYGDDIPLYFYEQPKSKYIIAHNPSFWNKEFLLSTLEKGQTPWQHEYQATCKMWQNPSAIRRKIAIYPCNWYYHAVERGKLVSESRQKTSQQG